MQLEAKNTKTKNKNKNIKTTKINQNKQTTQLEMGYWSPEYLERLWNTAGIRLEASS
jgi:hypothetical protein